MKTKPIPVHAMDDKIIARFWAKVDKNGPLPDQSKYPSLSNCWTWMAFVEHTGYGVFKIKFSDNAKAHRFSWFILNGEIPDGMLVLHHCDNPKCVNPSHLFLGDHSDNQRDKISKGRMRTVQRTGFSRARYMQIKKSAAGICELCPEKLSPFSKVYCQKHLDKCRERVRRYSGTGANPRTEKLGREWWRTMDLRKNNEALAKQFGFSTSAVRYWRKKIALMNS